MASLSPECDELKARYDSCFNDWYLNKYMKGETTKACEDEFKKYRACLKVVLARLGLDKKIETAVKEDPGFNDESTPTNNGT